MLKWNVPDASALSWVENGKTKEMTYKDLRTHVRRLSGDELFEADDTVGIAPIDLGLYRCDLAVLDVGACYVPLDPSYPKERLAIFVEDAKMSVLLAQNFGDLRLASGAYENRRFKSFFLMNLLQRISHSQDRPRILQRHNPQNTKIRMRTMTRI